MLQRIGKYIWYFTGILLCLTLFSFWMSRGFYARYSTTITGEDSARVAKFEILRTGTYSEDLVIELAPGETTTKTIVITNNSEVVVEYSLDVENLTENLPLKLEMETHAEQQIAIGDSVELDVTISWPATTNDSKLASLSSEIDAVRVTVGVDQID